MLLLEVNWTQAQVLAAFVTGIVSIVLAIWSFMAGRINQREAAKIQNDVERLKGELADKNSENAARRAYEFEARKKLYHEYEPIRFQLVEACENAAYLIHELCERFITIGEATKGNLPFGNYFNLSTMYHLMMPLVYFKIGKSKLTNIDLQLNSKIHLQYLLNKQIYISFYSDADVSKIAGIDYTPYTPNWKELREVNPTKYRRQGFAVGRLDNAIEELKNSKVADQPIGFGDFERKMKEVDSNDYSGSLGALKDLFKDFFPFTRPVLWRIIIIQYALHDLIIYTSQNDNIIIDNLKKRVEYFIELNESKIETGQIGMMTKDVVATTHLYFTQKVFPMLEYHFKSI